MRSFLTVIALLSLVSTVYGGFYGSGDAVVELTASNFEQKVVKGDGIWLVEFYAPWCGHCQSLTPEWKKASLALQGIVNVAAVDMDAHPSVGGPYNVKGFPTIKLFGLDKKKPVDYNGQRTAAGLTEFALSQVKTIVNQRLSGKGGSSSSSSSSKSSGSSGSGSTGGGNGKVIELTDSSFDEVLKGDDLWLVEFYAPWCGHCKSLAPEWKKAAGQLGGIAKLGAVDATVYGGLAQKYGIKGYPTIKVFKAGSNGKAIDYEGGRTANDIVTYAKNQAEANAPPKEVLQLTGDDVLQKQCVEGASTCLVAILPHILDSGAKGRNQYIDVLKEVAKKYKSKPFSYVWFEVGTQPKLESDLNVSDYPAIVAINVKKQRFANLVGSFTLESIGDFVRNLISGREKTIPLQNSVTVVNADKWDGKDGKPPQEDKDDL